MATTQAVIAHWEWLAMAASVLAGTVFGIVCGMLLERKLVERFERHQYPWDR